MGYRDKQDLENMIGRLKEERAEKTGQARVPTASMVKGQSSGLTHSTKAEGSSIYDGDGRRRRETNQPGIKVTDFGEKDTSGFGPLAQSDFDIELESQKQEERGDATAQNNEQREQEKQEFVDLTNNQIISQFEANAENTAWLHETMISLYGESNQEKLISLNNMTPTEKTAYINQLKTDYVDWCWQQDLYDVKLDGIDKKYDELLQDDLAKIDVRYEGLARVGELEENPEYSFLEWQNVEPDINVQMQGYEKERINLVTLYNQREAMLEAHIAAKGEMGYLEWEETKEKLREELYGLGEQIDKIETLIDDTSAAMSGNMEDMSLTQLTIRAENDIQNMFIDLEQAVIGDYVTWFDDAVEEWRAGDDSAMRDIVLQVYGGEKHLEEIEDFGELRDGYVKVGYETGELDEQLELEYEKGFKYIIDEMSPYIQKAANFKETENGYTFEMTPELADYARQYAMAKEQQENINGKLHTAGATVSFAATGAFIGAALGPAGIGVGAATGAIIGAAFSIVSSIAVSASTEKIVIREDEWDDIAVALLAKDLTDETFIIEYDREAKDVVDITKKE